MKYKMLICCICLVFIMSGTLFAQTQEELQRLVGQHMAKQKRERSRSIQEMRSENPALADFEQKLLTISKKINEITTDYAKGKISKKSAATRLRPLIQRSREISSDPDYLTEKQLYSLLKSVRQSPSTP